MRADWWCRAAGLVLAGLAGGPYLAQQQLLRPAAVLSWAALSLLVWRNPAEQAAQLHAAGWMRLVRAAERAQRPHGLNRPVCRLQLGQPGRQSAQLGLGRVPDVLLGAAGLPVVGLHPAPQLTDAPVRAGHVGRGRAGGDLRRVELLHHLLPQPAQ